MASDPLSVLVIDENHIRAAIIEAGLREAGYEQVSVVNELVGIARHITNINPDVIVIDIENPGRDMLEAVFALTRSVKRPIAMFVDKSDKNAIEDAVEAGVSAYIVDGLRKERVKPILDMAISRFNAFSRMERELEDARSELVGRKAIEQAKQILIRSKNISENEAYQILRRAAMNNNCKIADIAKSLITTSGLLE